VITETPTVSQLSQVISQAVAPAGFFGCHIRVFRGEIPLFPPGRKVFGQNYTFSLDPLQQYLIEFPDGRLKSLSIAWDSRPKDKGGQFWFHLYPNEEIRHDDVLQRPPAVLAAPNRHGGALTVIRLATNADLGEGGSRTGRLPRAARCGLVAQRRNRQCQARQCPARIARRVATTWARS
jgi:hypothetical protein